MKINLLLITSLFPNPVEQNRGIFVADLVKELKQRCNVTVISLIPFFPKLRVLKRFKQWYKFSLVPGNYTINSQEVICAKYWAVPKIVALHSFFLFIAILPKIWRLHKEKRFDLINVHWLFPDGVASCWIARILKIPIVLTAHGSDINWYLNTNSRKNQIMKALKGANKITVVSEQQNESLKKLNIAEAKIKIIHNGFDGLFEVSDKLSCRKELGLPANPKIIAFIGRLVKVKGFKYLISAVQKLENTYEDDYQVIVVGDGISRNAYEEEVDNLGLSSRIKFYGEKRHKELSKWFAASDIVCLPSISEGCPTVVIEALACGRPVVASRVGEIPKLVNRDNGILFAPRDVEEFTEAILKAFDHKWDAANIRKTIEHLTWQESAKKYLNVYEEVLN